MQEDQIFKSIIDFEYDNEALALHCNAIIESIFDTHVLPEMEKSISNTISKDIPIQIDTLEIDIGTINKEDLETELANRIKSALEKALQNTLNAKSDRVFENDSTNAYLKAALELYLSRGFFPAWLFKTSLEELLIQINAASKGDVIEIIKRHSSNPSAMKRLYTLKIKVLGILPDLDALNASLIAEDIADKHNAGVSMFKETQELRVNNAGLIIFWPFLTQLFDGLDLLDDNELFIDEKSRHKAIYVLQHLAFSQIHFPEYDLVLNKLLVGMPLENLLVPLNILSKDEIGLAESLMQGIIDNWEKLGDLSVETLQYSFLQREGIMKIENEQITLNVGDASLDVLLDFLPWDISLIQLPWMEKPIHVKWQS